MMLNAATPVPDFTTSRLRLRRLAIEDARAMHEAYGDASAMTYWDAPPTRDLAETEQRIRRSVAVDPRWHAAWAVTAGTDGRFIGMTNYHGRDPGHRRLAVGWILIPAFWGHGYMREAMAVLLNHCFEELNTHRIEAEIEPCNTRSARLAERLGFAREGLLRDRLFVAGQPRSVYSYALLRSAWNPGALP